MYGIGNTRGSIAGLVNDCSDDDNDFNLFIDFFNSATAVIKADKESLEVIDELTSSNTAIKLPNVVVRAIKANTLKKSAPEEAVSGEDEAGSQVVCSLSWPEEIDSEKVQNCLQEDCSEVPAKKTRLAPPGILNSDSRGNIENFITPANSPTRAPVISSTPLAGASVPVSSASLPLRGASALPGSARLPPHPPYSPARQIGLSRPRPDALLPPRSSVRVSVISPRIFVTGGDCGVSSVHSEPEVSLDWDNFAEIPKFGEIGTTKAPEIHTDNCSREADDITGIEDIQKVTLVDTSVSSLSSNNNIFDSQKPAKMDHQNQESMQQLMIQENEKSVALRDTVYDLMDNFKAERVRMGNIMHVQSKLDKISDVRDKFRNVVRYYQKTFAEFHPSNCSALKSQLDTMISDVESYEDAIWSRVEQLQSEQQPPPPPSNSGGGWGGTAPVHAAPHSSSSSGNQGTSSPSDLVFRKNVYKDCLLHLRDDLSLPDHDTIEEHWAKKTDSEVSQAMKDIGTWQKTVKELSKVFREYEKVATSVGDEELETLSEDFEEVRIQVKAVVLAVKSEDEKRNLQTLLPAKSDKVKYPQFSGDPGEDFVKFKEKLNECFRKNRVPASDQLDKLRENLKGQALKRVPDTLKNLEKAWENLSEAFGSPLLVLKERLKSLSKLGNIPPDTNPGKQITWFLDFEAVIQDILDLGNSDDPNMQMGAYGPPVQEQILKALAENPLKQREVAKAGQGKHPKQKILAYQNSIQNFRKEVQLALVESGVSAERRKTTGGGGANHAPPVANIAAPERHDGCRVCKHVHKQGNKKKHVLFENHLGKNPYGCPIFMKMKTKDRMQLATTKDVKLCLFCLSHNVIFDEEHLKKCKQQRDRGYSCASPGCNLHMWVCVRHAESSNKSQLKKEKDRLSERGFEFIFTALSSNANVCEHNRAAVEELELKVKKEMLPVPDGSPMFMFFGAKGRTRSIMVFFDSGCSRFIMRDCIPEKELPASCLRRGQIPIGGVGATTVYAEAEYLVAMETSDGMAQQMQGLVVKNITTDFPQLDISSAADEIMKAASPRKDNIRRCKLPKSIGGSVDCLIGIHYNQLQPKLIHMLPSGLAIYKTTLAPHIKGYNYVLGGPHASFDTWLAQHGNQNHLLLENFIAGLAQWRSLGPPSLSQYMMSEADIIEAKDKNMADDELDYYKELMEFEKEEYKEIQLEMSARIEELDEEDSVHLSHLPASQGGGDRGGRAHVHAATNPVSPSKAGGTGGGHPAGVEQGDDGDDPDGLCELVCTAQGDCYYETCIDCGEEFHIKDSVLMEDEKLSRLKQILDSQETGLDISYRCVRCRSCLDCKKAEKVDKISLREESEDYEIKNSVKLDWENKKITVSLPLRGKEREFLTSNHDRALKILESQCKKYHSDTETKITVNAAFKKLIDKGFIVFLEEMTNEQLDKFTKKEVQYYLPWRIQFKPTSASTPVRVVFDASSGTMKRKDGTGGRCLNDLVCKGSIDSLDLMRVVLRFMIGPYALVADLSKMYNQFSLMPEYWNLQRVLIKDDINPASPVREACVTTAIYGVKSSAGQTEYGLKEIAKHIENEKPEVAKLLTAGRYVDNLLDSKVTKEDAVDLANDTTEILNRLSLPTKGFSFSGEAPQEQETIDGISIEVNGMKWTTAVDTIEVSVPPLHFGTKRRGRVVGVEVFEHGGDFAKMDQFVPEKLTRRMIVSKRASLYDSLGKLEPVKGKLKLDERQVVLLTEGWDDVVPDDVRNKWLRNFMLMEQMRGIKFSRARMPTTAVDTRMRLITLVDAALELIMMVTYCGFKLSDGTWSCQQLIGRSALATGTIPRNELSGASGGSNLACVVKKSLPDWVESSILASDSEIALHWIISDSRKLSMWHRNRVIQTRRNIDLDNIFYVGTDYNVADVGTRADKVTIGDVGPDSRYENGDAWMKLEIEDAVEQEYIKPASVLKPVPKDRDQEYQEGFLFEREPEILTRGHLAGESRMAKIEERMKFSSYEELLPTRRSFPAMVRITSYVIAFVTRCRDKADKRRGVYRGWSGKLLMEATLWFSAFPTTCVDDDTRKHEVGIWVHLERVQTDVEMCSLVQSFAEKDYEGDDKYYSVHETNIIDPYPTDRYINAALLYYFRKATMEVLEFCNKKVLERKADFKDGILLSKGRIVDGMNFVETGDMDTVNLGDMCVKTRIPLIERFSPLAYSIAQHIHWTVAKHRGMESCMRYSLEHVHILQGMSLFKELSDECMRCRIKRGKFIKASMGPLSEKQLIVAPPFYACQVDLFGPCRVFVPGYEKETRATKVKESKVWVFVAVCVVTSTVNMQVCEMKDTGAMMEAFIRLACEVGYPKYVMCDKESSLLAAAKEIQINLRNLSHQLYTEHGVLFETCAVGGHDQHGKVERTIRTVQDSLDDLGWKKMRLHAMGVQTLCKQIENAYNNLPLGYRYERGDDNTMVLKMIVPNMLRLGRINSRAIDGPVKLTNENRKMLGQIQEKFAAWYKIWCQVYVPKLMAQKRDYESDRDLKTDDIVYYQKKESELSSPWVIGRVDQVVRGRDGIIRKALIKYTNAKENIQRVTERSARKLIKIWSADDPDLQADLLKIQERIDQITQKPPHLPNGGEVRGGSAPVHAAAHPGFPSPSEGPGAGQEVPMVHDGVLVPAYPSLLRPDKCQCCCLPHCRVSFHNIYKSKSMIQTFPPNTGLQMEAQLDVEKDNEVYYMEEEEKEVDDIDNITALIMSVGVDLS